MHEKVQDLISCGFPVEQIVLRLDPIICNKEGITKAENVLKLFKDTGIRRCRYSFMDMYEHVKIRFKNAGLELPQDSFTVRTADMYIALSMLEKYEEIYEFESCSEDTYNKLGCISNKDKGILGLNTELYGSAGQRKACLCPKNKVELLLKAKKCSHACLYCYWKN